MTATRPHKTHELVEHLFRVATEHASTALSRWTQGQVTLVLDGMIAAPLEELGAALGIADEQLAMVVLGIDGDPGGQVILAFDDVAGRRLAAALLRRPFVDEAGWGELEMSAVMETGNILASSYLSELSRIAGRQLSPSPPYFVQDFGASVIE